jgi:hypothetical protein
MKSMLQGRAVNPKLFESIQNIKASMRQSSSMNVVEDSDCEWQIMGYCIDSNRVALQLLIMTCKS